MTLDQLLELPVGLLVALGVILVAELALLVVGLIAWARTTDDRMPPPSKWLWLVLILVLQIIGPVIFLVLRRSTAHPAAASEPSAAAPRARRATADDTADLLYGPRDNT